MYDSVFSQHTPTAWEAAVLKDLGKVEQAIATQLKSCVNSRAKALLSQLEGAIASGNVDKVQSAKWTALPEFERILWGLWLSGWRLGGRDAKREISPKRAATPHVSFSQYVEFSEPQQGVSIRNVQAERAIRARINRLSRDVTNQEFARIRQHLLAAVTPQPDTGNPISRDELVSRISQELGGVRFENRAKQIARTELTFAYNAGRLATYRESGLVEAVRFYAISDERTCPVCSSRNNLTFRLDDPQNLAASTPPMHPNCRCVLSPILAVPGQRVETQTPPVAAPVKWLAAAVLAAVLLGSMKQAAQKLTVPALGVLGVGATVDAVNVVGAIAQATGETLADYEDVGLEDLVTAPVTAPVAQQVETVPQEVAPTIQPDEEAWSSPVTVPPTVQPPQPIPAVLALKAGRPAIQILGIDLNRASFEELQNVLPPRQFNVGQINALIRYRNANPLSSIDDLKYVEGLGTKTVERLKNLYYNNLPLSVFINNAVSPAQLWASNLGLTKAQAQSIIEELQRNGQFANIQDFERRMRLKGIGPTTIRNMRDRAIFLQNRIIQRAKQQVGVSVGDTPPSPPTPYSIRGADLPSAARREVIGRPNPPAAPPSPTRTPAPYRSVPRQQEVVNPAQLESQQLRQQLTQTGDELGLKASEISERYRQLIDKPDQRLQRQLDEIASLRSQYDASLQRLSASEPIVNQIEAIVSNLESNFANLFDPLAPNYFESAPQQIQSQLAEIRRLQLDLSQVGSLSPQSINRLTQQIEANLSKFERQRNVQKLNRQIEQLQGDIQSWQQQILDRQQIDGAIVSDWRLQSLQQLIAMQRQSEDLMQQLSDLQSAKRNSIRPLLDASNQLRTRLEQVQLNAQAIAFRIDALQQRLNRLPLLKNQLSLEDRVTYDQVRDLRTIQNRIANQTKQYRQTTEIANQNLRNIEQSRQGYFERYNQQIGDFERSYSPVLQDRLKSATEALQQLKTTPHVNWLLQWDGWTLTDVPSDLAIALQGMEPPGARSALRELVQQAKTNVNRVAGNIESIKQLSEFKYLDPQNKQVLFSNLLNFAQDWENYWAGVRTNSLNLENIGSTRNRLNSLWRDIEAARTSGNVQNVYPQVTLEDALGYSRQVLIDLEEWERKYGELKTSRGGTTDLVPAPIDELNRKVTQFKQDLLNEIGRVRIEQSQFIEQAYQDAIAIKERIAADTNRNFTFDINNKAIDRQSLLQQLDKLTEELTDLRVAGTDRRILQLQRQRRELMALDAQLRVQLAGSSGDAYNELARQVNAGVEQIQEIDRTISSLAKPVEIVIPPDRSRAPQIQSLADERDLIIKQLQSKQQQIDALTAAPTTNRKTQQIAKLQTEIAKGSDRVNQITREIRELRLPPEQYRRLSELKELLAVLERDLSQKQKQLGNTTRQLQNLTEQLQILGEGSQRGQRLQKQIEGLRVKSDAQLAALVRQSSDVGELKRAIADIRNDEEAIVR